MSTYVGVKINMFETPTSIRYSHVFPLGCVEVRLFDLIVLGMIGSFGLTNECTENHP